MALSSAGIGSGLDVNGLVTQLVSSERAPTDQRISKIESTTKAQISAFGAIRSGLSGLQAALDKFKGVGALAGRKTAVGTDAGFSATAAGTAAPGTYSVVVDRLATAQKLQSAPRAADSPLGYGTLTITAGSGDPVVIDVADGKGTLAGLRDAINAKGSGLGFAATIVKGDGGDVLTLTATKPGVSNTLTVAASGGDGGLAALNVPGGGMTEVTPAADARVVIDGVVRTASTNALSDAITGVTLNLTTAKPGQSFSLDISSDPASLRTTLGGFVSAYNAALAAIRTQSAAGGEGKTAAALSGDAAPRSMMQSLRGMVSANYSELSTLGLKTAVDGSLTLDSSKCDAALAADPEAVQRLFGEEASFGKGFRETVDQYVKAGGMLSGRTDNLNARLKSVSAQRDAFNLRMQAVEANYRKQFTALDAMMSKMQSTSSFLSQQLSQL